MLVKAFLAIALVSSDGHLDIYRFEMESRAQCEAAVEALSDREHLRVGCVNDIALF